MNINLKVTSKMRCIRCMDNCIHFLFHCRNFFAERNTLLSKITNIDSNILNQTGVTKTLLFRNLMYSQEVILEILNVIIEFF